jgi:hypothetical protein
MYCWTPFDLSQLLSAIGRQLQGLHLKTRVPQELLHQIPRLCPNLESILMNVEGETGEDLSRQFKGEMMRLGDVMLF